ncbi:MAG TPA: hypothetical protein IAB06_03600 [Candidatus Avacidaminococcus intestinavium]|uniref:Uncharacterized protein n=1 Tax=Candidatus Avacidaminococcus intestinavium TaxID=2840684 RepID=A0A9D1MPN0_9FIRM|nr:hypothetical protein [Candidatus Avacidaminococcus intestinavium]
MIEEPCVQQEFYLDAVAIVLASSKEEALQKLKERAEGWRIADLECLEPQVFSLKEAKVIFTDIRG